MGIDDREYMKERYRRRGGAVGIPIWRDRHARMEYDEADMVAGRYRAQAGSMLRLGPTSSATGSRKNMLAAAALGFAAIVPTSVLMAPVGARLAHGFSRYQLETIMGLFILTISIRFLVSILLGV